MNPLRAFTLLALALAVAQALSWAGRHGRGRLGERLRGNLRLLGRCITATVILYWAAIIARLIAKSISQPGPSF